MERVVILSQVTHQYLSVDKIVCPSALAPSHRCVTLHRVSSTKNNMEEVVDLTGEDARSSENAARSGSKRGRAAAGGGAGGSVSSSSLGEGGTTDGGHGERGAKRSSTRVKDLQLRRQEKVIDNLFRKVKKLRLVVLVLVLVLFTGVRGGCTFLISC